MLGVFTWFDLCAMLVVTEDGLHCWVISAEVKRCVLKGEYVLGTCFITDVFGFRKKNQNNNNVLVS